MVRWKNMSTVFVLFLAAVIGMYGCASQQRQVVVEEESVEATSPDYTTPDTGMDTARAVGVGMASQSGAFPTGDRATSVVFIEKSLPSQTRVGHTFDFVTRVTNLTDAIVKDVVVYAVLPGNFDVASSDPGIQGDPTSDKVHWNIGDLGARETKTITVQGAPTNTGDLEFCCTEVTYDYDPSLCMTTAVVQPELKITKEAPSEVMICDTIPYRIVVSNTGTGDAENVQINDPLPSGLSTMSGESTVMRDVGTLHAGESREIIVDVKADRAGTFDNAASAVASGDLSANSNSTSTLVTQPMLAITKTGPEKRYIGRTFTYNIKVTNEGNGPAVNTSLEDCTPLNTTMVSVSDGGTATGKGALWNLGTLQPQESREVSVTVRAESKGEAKNCAVASAECADAVTDCSTTMITGISAILLEVIDVADPIEIGGIETYEIAVTNQGSATDTNIIIICALEEGTMEYVSSDGPTAGTVAGNTVTFTPLASLAPKQKVIWRVNVRAVGEGDVRFGVTMDTDQLDRNVKETESTNFYQ
ncbi:MAG: DUF11 domain-containing protein [Candidatus Scalindua sp.]|nr:DUF11 domain-containing protein [Candidatus Scalindua sp.]